MTQEKKNIAIYLKRYGHQITVFDRRPDIRNIEFSGRSINLAMSNRGWNALRAVGIEDEIKEIAIPLDKRAMHVIGKEQYFQKYGKEGEAIWSISRGVLNKRMIDLAEQSGVEFRFEEKVWPKYLQVKVRKGSGSNTRSIWYLVATEHFREFVIRCSGAVGLIILSVLSMLGIKN
mgnify:CR=1 FL=1